MLRFFLSNKIIYTVGFAFLVISFLFLPHTVELTGTLETWFPYKGLIAYKDFAAYHFPLGRLILLPIHLLFNWDLRPDPFIALITALVSLHLIYTYSKRLNCKLALVAGISFFSVFFWYGATAILFFHEMLIGLLLTVATLLIFKTQEAKQINLKTTFLIGLSLSLAEFSGQIATPTALVMLGLSVLLWRTKSNFIQAVKYCVIGFAIPLFGLLLYFYKSNALYEFYFWNIPYYFTYNNNPRSPLLSLPLTDLLAFYIPFLLMLAFFCLRFKKRNFESGFLFLVSFSSIPFIFFSIFHPHHYSFILPILALTFSKAVYLLSKYNLKKILFLGLVIFTFIAVFSLIPWHYQHFKSPSLEITNDTYPGDHMYETVQWVKNNTPENSKILVIGDSMFYLRSNRLPASRPSKGMPYSWEPFLQVKEELLASPAKYWIVDQRFVNRLGDTYNRPYMVEFIRDQLQTCYKKTFTDENWEVYQRICN